MALQGVAATKTVPGSKWPLNGYGVVEMVVRERSPVANRRVGELSWPQGSIVVADTRSGELVAPEKDLQLRPGARIVLLVPTPAVEETASAKEALS